MASKFADILAAAGVDFLAAPLARAHGAQPRDLADDRWFVENVADFAWLAAPPPLRVLGRQGLGWDAELLRLRPAIYEAGDDRVSLRADWKDRLAQANEKLATKGLPENRG